MIGQKKLIEKIEYGNIPNPLLIIGTRGMGKHTLLKEITNKLNFEAVWDISTKLNPELVNDLYIEQCKAAVMIDLAELAVGKKLENMQNSILKFVEEPPAGKQIILLANTKNQVLDTILNRCQIWVMEDYSVDELRQIGGDNLKGMSDELIRTIIKTPLEALTISDDKLNGMTSLADTMMKMIGTANIANTLTISNDKVDYDADNEKFNFDILLNILINTASKYAKESGDVRYINAYNLTRQLREDVSVANVNKRYLFNRYLLELRSLLR